MAISLRWLTLGERVLLSIFVGAIFYIVYFLKSNPSSDDFSFKEEVVSDVPAESKTLLMDLPTYEPGSSKVKRNFFNSSLDASNLPSLNTAGDFSGQLKVVGIVSGKPMEIILEDTASHKTFFIKEGQDQDGISIQTIEANQVILNYKGQPVAVSLKETK